MVARRSLLLVWALGLGACAPNVEGRASVLDSPRVLAVRSEPAEAKPGATPEQPVQYIALYASPDDKPDATGIEWAFCDVQKPLDVIGPAAPACLVPNAKVLTPIALGTLTAGPATLPKDVCSTFGPSPSTPKPGQPASRPADPDTTGGYYQPVRLLVPAPSGPDYVVGVTRLNCGLPNSTQEQSLDYSKRYRPNENTALDALDVVHGSGKKETLATDGSASTLSVARGEHIAFTARWAVCPTTPVCGDGICGAGEDTSVKTDPAKCDADCIVPAGCTGAACQLAKGCTGSEPYVELDPVRRVLVDRREAIRISWFATDGDFDHDRTGRTEDDARETFSENDWTAPSSSGPVHVWIIIRDDRGGVGWNEFQVNVGS